MVLSEAAYARQLKNLLPPGDAFSRAVDSNVHAFMTGLAVELARVDQRGNALVDESDPRTISETLHEWEHMLALPDPCVAVDQTTAQRVGAVVARYIARGGQSPQYFIDVAAALGFVITVTEFHPDDEDSDVDHPMYGDDWAYAWQVNAPTSSVHEMTEDDDVDEPYARFGNQLLECTLSRLKPAHTVLLFSYS